MLRATLLTGIVVVAHAAEPSVKIINDPQGGVLHTITTTPLPDGGTRIVDERSAVLGGGMVTQEMDAQGLDTLIIDRDGRKTLYSHDAEGRCTQVTLSDGSICRILYAARTRAIERLHINGQAVAPGPDVRWQGQALVRLGVQGEVVETLIPDPLADQEQPGAAGPDEKAL